MSDQPPDEQQAENSDADVSELHLTIRGLGALNQSTLGSLAATLEDACVREVAAVTDGRPAVRLIKGPHHTSVERRCPDCGSTLGLHGRVTADPQNGATADVDCPDCPFSGYAQFRIVDIHGPSSQDPKTRASAVANGQLTSQVHPITPLP